MSYFSLYSDGSYTLKTTGELIEELKQYPPDTPYYVDAPYDCGYGHAGGGVIETYKNTSGIVCIKCEEA